MRFRDYVRLGRISLKNRKKSTRNTVCGISFGLTLLVAVLFFTLAFSVDLMNAINDARNVSCFAIPVTNELDAQDGYAGLDEDEDFTGSYRGILFGDTEREALYGMLGGAVEEIVSQEYLGVFASNDEYTLNGERFLTEWREGRTVYNKGTYIKVLRGDNQNCIPAGIHSDLARLGSSLLAAGQGFSQNSKGEIMISETLARLNGKTPEEAIGGLLSLNDEVGNISGNILQCLDNDNNPDNAYIEPEPYENIKKPATLFENYRIVGVISDAYYQLNDLLEEDAHVWISGDSYYGEAEPTLPKYRPVLRFHTGEDGRVMRVVTYTDGFDAMQQAALQDGMFFAAQPRVGFGYAYGVYTDELVYNSVVYFVQCKDFDSSQQISSLCLRGFKRLGFNFDQHETIKNFTCSLYRDFLSLYQVGNYVMLVLYAFGGVVFFATLLNLYNSVQYSVQVRRRYLGMMRALGAKSMVLPRLYFVEILLIFARSLPFAAVFGGGLSLAIKIVIDRAFANSVPVLNVAIRLRFGFFFAAFAIALAVLVLAALLISRVSVRRAARRPIIDVMSAES